MIGLKRLFITLTVLTGLVYSQQSELLLRAEEFSYKSVGGKANPGWNIWSNGFISESFDFPEGGKYNFTIKARGDKAIDTWPAMKVTINDAEIFSSPVDSSEFKDFQFTSVIEKGYCRIKIYFINDYHDKGKKEDRNLHAGQLKIEPAGSGLLPRVLSGAEIEKIQADRKEKLIRKSRDETEIIRKGVLEITVIDKEGRLIKNAVVKVDQSKHEFWFGTSVSTFRLSKHDKAVRDRYLGLLKDNFNSAVHENALKWHSTEKEEGKISYKDVDTILSWCEENNISMRGHCIFWEVEKVVQPWVKNLGREELKQAIIRRATGLTERYRGRISEYDVNNEMMHGSFYKDRLGEEIWKVMFDTAKKGDPDAVLYVNDYDIMTNGFMEEEYVKHIRHLTDMGASVGGIGIQGHFNTAVDAFQVERALNILSKLNLPIKITEFDIDVEDEQVKAEGLEVLYRICFAHPEVKGILMWGFWEGAHWRPRAALFKKDFSPTLSAKMYRKLVFDEWWTKAAGKTDQNGKYSCRAFYGDHQITVTLPDGKTIVREVTMSSKEKNKNLRFTIDN